MEATVATYKDRVTKISLWIILQVVQMTGISVVLWCQSNKFKINLYTGGHDSDAYAYYSGVSHAEALQTNFSRLSANGWQKWIHQGDTRDLRCNA